MSKPFPYDLAKGLPVPLAISAMLAVRILKARTEEERSDLVHRFAWHIADAIGGPVDSHVRMPRGEGTDRCR